MNSVVRKWSLVVFAVVLLIAVAFVYLGRGTEPTSPAGIPSALPKNIPALVAILESGDSANAILAAQALGETGSPDAIAPLLSVGTSSSTPPALQAACLGALGALNLPLDAAPIMAIADSTTDATIRAAALGLLGSLKVTTRESCALYIRHMDDPDLEVRNKAYAAITAVTGADFHFKSDDTPEKRREVINKISQVVNYKSSGN